MKFSPSVINKFMRRSRPVGSEKDSSVDKIVKEIVDGQVKK